MSKRLPVPMICQPAKSLECGIACTAMILRYDGITTAYHDIQRALPIRPDFGLYIYELGSYFIQHGYQVDVMNLNTNLFRIDQMGISTAAVRNHVTNIDYTNPWMRGDMLRPGTKTLVDFIDHGGTFTVKIPTADDIIAEIDQGRPVLIANTGRFLYDREHGFFPHAHNEHFSIISGYDATHFYLNDPAELSSKGQIHAHRIDHVMYGIYANTAPSVEGGSILKLRPA